ncbi:CrpP-related protein [Rhizobium tubonense]|uniref:Uncharacterized protein n=1 Tax=Rhizobium tubonense TaxID=484088 RepID=A0A2W4D3K2_9HYPH|nr:CrpP-related protein [Rhizobium tubonense]PZM16785.1 hypothetical protein CPY51_00580 [Rhizobium tubonense]
MKTDWADIERMGATARANGNSLTDNPFLSDAKEPASTIADWEARRDTWILGWTLEDAFRRQRLSNPISGASTEPRKPY